MKKRGILNSQLLNLVVDAGHGDLIVVTDRGFPLPSKIGIKVIDLGIAEGIPSFLEIVSLLVNELEIEKIIHAEESIQYCSETINCVKKLLSPEIPCNIISHQDFKDFILSGHDEKFGRVIGFVRTGEFTSYSNIMLQCGVVF